VRDRRSEAGDRRSEVAEQRSQIRDWFSQLSTLARLLAPNSLLPAPFRIRRASLHAPSGFYLVFAAEGKNERHLENEAGLDRSARGYGIIRYAPGLHAVRW